MASFLDTRQPAFAMIALGLACALVSACSHEPPRTGPSLPQLEREAAVNARLPEEMDRQFTVVSDREVTLYLSQLAATLAAQVPALKGRALRVSLISPPRREADFAVPAWESFALPTGQIFLPIDLVRHLKFENELAAAIGLELAHLAQGHLSQKLRAIPVAEENAAVEVAGSPARLAGLFEFSAQAELEASALAADLLYRSGYDPRGVAALWDHYKAQLGKAQPSDKNQRKSVSPYPVETLNQLAEGSRQLLAQYTPLRNPIVRSPRFLAIHQRILRK